MTPEPQTAQGWAGPGGARRPAFNPTHWAAVDALVEQLEDDAALAALIGPDGAGAPLVIEQVAGLLEPGALHIAFNADGALGEVIAALGAALDEALGPDAATPCGATPGAETPEGAALGAAAEATAPAAAAASAADEAGAQARARLEAAARAGRKLFLWVRAPSDDPGRIEPALAFFIRLAAHARRLARAEAPGVRPHSICLVGGEALWRRMQAAPEREAARAAATAPRIRFFSEAEFDAFWGRWSAELGGGLDAAGVHAAARAAYGHTAGAPSLIGALCARLRETRARAARWEGADAAAVAAAAEALRLEDRRRRLDVEAMASAQGAAAYAGPVSERILDGRAPAPNAAPASDPEPAAARPVETVSWRAAGRGAGMAQATRRRLDLMARRLGLTQGRGAISRRQQEAAWARLCGAGAAAASLASVAALALLGAPVPFTTPAADAGRAAAPPSVEALVEAHGWPEEVARSRDGSIFETGDAGDAPPQADAARTPAAESAAPPPPEQKSDVLEIYGQALGATADGLKRLEALGGVGETVAPLREGAASARQELVVERMMAAVSALPPDERAGARLALLERALGRAATLIEAGRITGPGDDTAYNALLRARRFAPSDGRVLQGFAQIETIYRARASTALRQSRFADFYKINRLIERIRVRAPI